MLITEMFSQLKEKLIRFIGIYNKIVFLKGNTLM